VQGSTKGPGELDNLIVIDLGKLGKLGFGMLWAAFRLWFVSGDCERNLLFPSAQVEAKHGQHHSS
jgi:hypothetical protein